MEIESEQEGAPVGSPAPSRRVGRKKVPATPGSREARAPRGSAGGRRAGRSAWVVAGVAGILLCVAAGAWFLTHRDGPTPAEVGATPGPAASPRGDRHFAESPHEPQGGAGPGDAPAFAEPPVHAPAPAPPPADFRGRGSIRGEVVLPRGLELPETWAVVVGPSRALEGRERAETRRVERPGSARDFELLDLPLGGYDVRIEGPGLGCFPSPVLLVRGSEHVFVNVAVHRLGILDGFLLDEDGRPLEGILVVLEDEVTGERRSTHTTVTGAYVFSDLADAEYRIYFGGVTHPLIPPGDLSFRAPSMRYPPRRLPPLGSLVVYTIDPEGNPIGNANLQGFSPSGGVIETASDAFGLARIANLRPGRYRLAARAADPEREGRISIDVEGGQEEVVRVALVPRE